MLWYRRHEPHVVRLSARTELLVTPELERLRRQYRRRAFWLRVKTLPRRVWHFFFRPRTYNNRHDR